jgi:RND family efflux transporter MFP subunit
MTKTIKFIKARWILLFAVLILSVSATFTLNSRNGGPIDTISPHSGDVIRTIKIAGKIVPRQTAALGFEIAGTISSVEKNVGNQARKGEILVRLDRSSGLSEIQRAEAELLSARAELAKLEGKDAHETIISSAKRTLSQSIRDAYTAADDAVYNKTDQLFYNPRGGYPEILYAFRGYSDLRSSINKSRVALGYTLEDWKNLSSKVSENTYTSESLSLTRSYLSTVANYLNDVSRAVNMFEPNDSLSQQLIDKYKNDVLIARDSINRATQALIGDEDRLTRLLSDVPVQVARVEAAKASLINMRSKVEKTTLISPITGIVSQQEAKIGQIVSPGIPVVTVISTDYIAEAYIPEMSLSGLELGNTALVTLDAYGANQTFEALVEHIDPAETLRDGVSTYKIRLAFTDTDSRIRSGMTANIEIETFRKNDTLLVPERTVLKENGLTYVYLLKGEKTKEKTEVVLGARDTRGNVEVLSGISVSDKIVISPPQSK